MTFLLAFIPLFVAIDPVGILPLFLGLTHGFSTAEKRRLAVHAVLTALIVGLTFSIAGLAIFRALGITPSDFKIAGGLLLLILSVKEIFGTSVKIAGGETADRFIGVVPLGIPLIAGPAMITTLLILHESHAFPITLAALLANLAITLTLLLFAGRIVRLIGEATSRVTAKVIAIFLAAIGVMMIRQGVVEVILGLR